MKAAAAWSSAAHPFPLAMVLVLTALIAVTTADAEPPLGKLMLVLLAMLFSQLAIGWSNDYLDRDVDAVHQPSKPVPSGRLDAGLMPLAIGVALVFSALSGVLLGPWPLLLLVVGTLCGLGYNFGLKSTPLSPLAFVVAFTVLPLFVWSGLDVFEAELLLLYPIGLTLPVAVHIANILPDASTDHEQGRQTVAVRLGRPRSIALVKACQLLPLILTAVSLQFVDYEGRVLAATLGAYVVLSLASAVLYTRRRRDHDVWAFRLVAIGAIVFAGGWLAAR